jgi:hypothetical protein
VRRRLHGPQAWVALIALSFAGGYLFFWGTFGTSLRGSLTSFLGPFYFLPVLVPVTFLAAKSFGELWHRDQLIAVVTFAAMMTVSGYLLFKAFEVNLRLTAEDRLLYEAITTTQLERSVVFLTPIYGPQLLHPFNYLQNAPEYDGNTVYALDRGDPRNLELLDAYPGRQGYKLRVLGHYRRNPMDRNMGSALEPLTVVKQSSLETTVTFENPTAEPYVMVSVAMNGRKDSFLLDTASSPGKRHELTLDINPQSVEARSPVVTRFRDTGGDPRLISVAVSVESEDGESFRTVYERHFGYDTDGQTLRVLFPGNVSVNELGAEDPLEALLSPHAGQAPDRRHPKS